ncbi:Putative O-antigen transporter [Pragia fontium]|uniref:oligosaccharide flippase family protein n=1 Tax=Pragia fontium TaxID=82985 RepID=UPI000E06FB1E|nr:oligosaccharide flippase family protein [Pragia fontium]SUB83912.1 Putative O-antigen transporter [Pragia fontium]
MRKLSKYKETVSNFMGLSSINIFNLLVTLITMPYLSRVLGPECYGIYFIYIAASTFSIILTDYSTNITGVRDVALAQNKSDQQKIYSYTQSIRFVFGFFSLVIFTVYTLYSTSNQTVLFVLSYYIISIFGYYLTAPWFHQGTSNMKFLALSTLIARIVQISTIFLFVKSTDDLSYAIMSNALVFIITGIVISIYRYKRIGVKESINFTHTLGKIRSGFDSFIGDFSPNLYSNIPLLIIGAFTTPAIYASYSIAMRLVGIAGSIQLMLSKAAYPVIVKGKGTLKALLLMNVLLSLPPIIAIILFGDALVNIFLGPGYTNSSLYLTYLSMGILFNGILSSFSYGYFLARGLDREFRNISLFVSVLSAIFGYVMIYFFSVVGAIIMFVFARFLFAICYFIIYRKIESKNIA